MATFTAKTTSNAPEVSDVEAVQSLIEQWEFIPMHGELTVKLRGTNLAIFGEAEFQPYRKVDVDHPDERYDEVDVEEFLSELAPYLEEDLVVQTIGSAKMRFPFGMGLAVVDAETGQVAVEDSLDWRQRMLADMES